MIAEFTSNGAEDFRQRFRGVFGWFISPETKNETLVKVTDVTARQTTFVDKEGQEYVAFADKQLQFKFIPVQQSVFTFDGMPYLAQRVPARQYRRGICGDNTSIRSVASYVGRPVDFGVVEAYVNGVRDPHSMLNHKTRRVLTRQLSIVDGNVYIYDAHIASLLDGGDMYIVQDMFRQEVLDFLAKYGHNYIKVR